MSLKSTLERAAHSVGAIDLVRFRHRSKVRILMYHRFHGDVSNLAAQCEHLSRHYHCISLTELAQAAKSSRPLPSNSLAITVDDGYRDFQAAFSVFQEYGLPVTLYVVSGFAAGELWLWPDQLLYLFENTPLAEAGIPIPGGKLKVNFSDPLVAFNSFAQCLIGMKNADRVNVMRHLPLLLETELPATAPERFAGLSWAELKRLASQGLDIGAHSATHPILSKVETGLAEEIAGSKARIEAETGTKVRHFCYPNGTRNDVNAAVFAEVEQAGYQTAVVAESGFAGPPFSRYALRRLGVGPELPILYFERWVAGYRVPAGTSTNDL